MIMQLLCPYARVVQPVQFTDKVKLSPVWPTPRRHQWVNSTSRPPLSAGDNHSNDESDSTSTRELLKD